MYFIKFRGIKRNPEEFRMRKKQTADRQTDRRTDRDRDIKTETETERKRKRETERERQRQKNIQ